MNYFSLEKNLVISDSLEKILKVSDVVIDFTNPENSVKVAEEAAKYKVVDVIGTTGFSKSQIKKFKMFQKIQQLLGLVT